MKFIFRLPLSLSTKGESSARASLFSFLAASGSPADQERLPRGSLSTEQRGLYQSSPSFFPLSEAKEKETVPMESPRELAEAVDAALAGLSCNVAELRAALNRARHGMLDLLRVPVS